MGPPEPVCRVCAERLDPPIRHAVTHATPATAFTLFYCEVHCPFCQGLPPLFGHLANKQG